MSVSAIVHLTAEPLRVKVLRAQPDVFGVMELSRDGGAADVIVASIAEADRIIGAFVDLKQQMIAGGAS
jgi:hypothetical protein